MSPPLATTLRKAGTTALWLALALLLGAPPAVAAPLRLLVAAGNDLGLAHEPPLAHATTDARRVADVFTTLGDVSPAQARVLPGASADALLAALARAARDARGRDPADVVLIVYFSGHGGPDALHLSGEALPLDRLMAAVAAVPAGLRFVILDACRSGGGRAKGFVPDEPFAISLDGPAGPTGAVLVRSSSDGESAQESDELGGAIFTHYLTSGLRGPADADRDGAVTLAEAYGYAYHRTLRRSAASPGPLQHASLDVDLAGAGPLVLTRTSRARAQLVLPAGGDTQYLVYALPAGSAVAEVPGSEDGPSAVAVPAGRLLVQRRAAGRHGAVELTMPFGGRAVLTDDHFAPVALERLVQKGGDLRMRHHLLGAGLGLMAASETVGQRAVLRYGHLGQAWVLGGGLELGAQDYPAPHAAVSERWVGLEASADYRVSIGPTEGRLGAGVAGRWIRRSLDDAEAERLTAAGFPPEAPTSALAVGPLLRAVAHLPLSDRFGAELALTTAVLAHREAGQPTVRWTGGLDLSLTWEP